MADPADRRPILGERMHGSLPAGTSNPVSAMPSGSSSRSAKNSGSGRPETRAISTPRMSEQVLYSQASPAWSVRTPDPMRDRAGIAFL